MPSRFRYEHTVKITADYITELPPSIKISLFVLLAFWDLALSAACGAAAVAVGAHVNNSAIVAADLKWGALGGFIRAGVFNAVWVITSALNVGWITALLRLGGAWVTSIGITAALCAARLDAVPSELLVASAVAALPLFASFMRGPMDPITGFAGTAINAVAGVVFAALAKHEGFYVSSNSAAAAAGAVYGAVHLVGWFPCNCVLSNKEETKETKHLPLHHIRTGNPLPDTVTTASGDESQLGDVEQRPNYFDRFGTRLWTMEQQPAEEPLVQFARGREPTEQDFRRARKARDAEELIQGRGSQVWFSRPMGIDSFVHYAILINGRKYELRMDHRFKKPYYNTALATSIDISRREVYLERPAQVFDRERLKIYSVYLIGWTEMSHEEIDAVCREVIEDWRYYLIWIGPGKRRGNCQSYLRRVTERIIPKDKRALDWGWFARGQYGVTEHETAHELDHVNRYNSEHPLGSFM